ncbi:MAG: DeoR family transcriptional regulator, partial [Planctomycetaceae bacterium]|nr:DeoR family transcriptional regulator [Planctomycetaceae bacterium]
SHKDYSGCTPIQIRVYNDKIKIWNDGQLPENWTIKNLLRAHSSRPYNPDIANAFFRSGYVESWGRGIAKIESQCIKAELPTPTFINEGSDFWIIFKKNINDKEYTKKLDFNNSELNERQKDALVYFKEKCEIITSEYAQRYNISDRTARRDLSDLVEREIIQNKGDNKSSHYFFYECPINVR